MRGNSTGRKFFLHTSMKLTAWILSSVVLPLAVWKNEEPENSFFKFKLLELTEIMYHYYY
jgi:hypothetical protein